LPAVAAHRRQAALLLVDMWEAGFVGHVHEVAGGIVDPGVIGAREFAALALVVPHQLHAAMRADVVEGADRHALAAYDDDRCGADLYFANDPVARTWYFAFFGDVQPDLAKRPAFSLKSIARIVDVERKLAG